MFVDNFNQVILQQHKMVWSQRKICMISGFRPGVNEIFALLWCYATQTVGYLPTFRNKLLVPSSMVKQSKASNGRDQYFVPKRREVTTNPRCVTSKKIKDFVQVRVVLEHATKAYGWVDFSSTLS